MTLPSACPGTASLLNRNVVTPFDCRASCSFMAKGQPADGDDDASKIVIFTNDVKKSENINAI